MSDSGYLRRSRLAGAAREHGWDVDGRLGGAPLSDGWRASRFVDTTWIQIYLWPDTDGVIEVVEVKREWGSKSDRQQQRVVLSNPDETSIMNLLAIAPDLLAAGGPPFTDG